MAPFVISYDRVETRKERKMTFKSALIAVTERVGQKRVAEKAGLAPSTVSRLVHGSRQGSLETVRKLVRAFPQLTTQALTVTAEAEDIAEQSTQ